MPSDNTERQWSYQALEQLVEERTREIEKRQQVAEGLRDILSVLNSDRSREEILDYILAQASHLLGSDAGVIYRLDRERQGVTVEASYGLPNEFAALEMLPLYEGGAIEAISRGKPVAVPDISVYLGQIDRDSKTDTWLNVAITHYKAHLGVPLVVRDRVYGALGLYYHEPQTFYKDEVQLAVAFGDQTALAIENARLRDQSSRIAVVAERERLARELHDSVTQSLYSLTLLAEAGQRLLRVGDLERVEQYLGRLGEIGQQALKEMRLLVYQLRPLVLRREGLVGALQQRLDAVEKRAGVDARLLVEGDINLPASVEEDLYRIALEALNNALKHAASTSVHVTVRADEEHVTLTVKDDGQGFDPKTEVADDKGGMGLTNMRERAEKLGGAFVLFSAPGKGTTVKVNLEVSQ